MRWKNPILTAAGLLLASSALQAVPVEQLKENYQSIGERNPFGLRPPQTPTVATNLPEVKPKVEIFLTGITSVGYPRIPKQAYFYTREQGKKDVTYYTLSEGAGRDGIQVLEIDPEKRNVKIKMDNAETLLSFDTHGVPVAAAAPGRPGVPGMAGQPGLPPVPGQGQPMPMPGAAPTGYDGNGQPIYNSPQPISQPNTVTPVNTMNPNPGSTGLRQIPSRRPRGGSTYNGGASTYNGGGASIPNGPGGNGGQPTQQQVFDPAEEYVKAHLNRLAKERETGIPLPPLPTLPQ